ncbi:hypothetical protein F4860DRAFT_496033 [Xylaria cubensis]|nr:hypothetical protein F4860DRAFT_496033 [Xylaria cubensis]
MGFGRGPAWLRCIYRFGDTSLSDSGDARHRCAVRSSALVQLIDRMTSPKNVTPHVDCCHQSRNARVDRVIPAIRCLVCREPTYRYLTMFDLLGLIKLGLFVGVGIPSFALSNSGPHWHSTAIGPNLVVQFSHGFMGAHWVALNFPFVRL